MSTETTTHAIAKDMTIGEVVAQYPPVADVFLSYGLHCVGCHVNAFETIVQGAMSHGMSEEEVDEMVAEANTYLARLAENANTLTLTPKAIEMLTTLAAEERKTGWGLRIEAIGSCCSKKTYNLEFEEKPREGDIILDTEFPVYIAPESHDAFKGATLDYIQSTRGSGFKIDKPRTKQGCGCGSGGGCS